MINSNDWERVERTLITPVLMKSEMESHSSFKAFKERYPDAAIEFSKGKRGATYELAVGNFTLNNSLVLYLEYEGYEGDINARISCEKIDSDIRGTNIRGALITQYIKENTCIEKEFTRPDISKGVIKFDK